MKHHFVLGIFLFTTSLLDAQAHLETRFAVAPQAGWTWDDAWNSSQTRLWTSFRQKSLGYTDQEIWVRCDWSGADAAEALVHWSAHIDHFEVRIRVNDHWQGPAIDWGDEASFRNDFPWVPRIPLKDLDAGTALVRIRSTNSVNLEFSLLSLQEFSRFETISGALSTGLLGVVLVLVLGTLLWSFTRQEPLYAIYSLYLISHVNYLLFYSGALTYLVHPGPGFNNQFDAPIEALAGFGALAFGGSANGLFRSKLFRGAALGACALFTVALTFHLQGHHAIALETIHGTVIFVIVGLFVLALAKGLRGKRFSLYYAGGVFVLITTTLVATMASLGRPFSSVGVLFSPQALVVVLVSGLFIEMTVLSLALADRDRRRQILFRRRREALEKRARLSAYGLVTAQLAHELSSPIHSIRLNLHLLENDFENPMPEKLKETWGAISQAALRMATLLDELQGTPSRRGFDEPVDLGQIVDLTLDIYRRPWAEQGVKVLFYRLPDSPPIRGNSQRLGQLVTNLVSNAVEASPARGQPVEVSVDWNAQDVTLTVLDRGTGMDAKTQRNLGQPLQTTKRRAQGHGLGWTVIQQVANEHQGRIEVDSTLGQGTRISVLFPRFSSPSP